MAVTRSNQFGAIDLARLAAFERHIGARLPDDFRAFLIAHNGGRPEPCNVFLPGDAEPFDCIHDTYGLQDGSTYFNLEYKQNIFAGRVPPTVLPLADDPGGNLYCIGIGGEHRGKVYFWDHETEGLDKSSVEPLSLIATSFAAFLGCLGPSDAA